MQISEADLHMNVMLHCVLQSSVQFIFTKFLCMLLQSSRVTNDQRLDSFSNNDWHRINILSPVYGTMDLGTFITFSNRFDVVKPFEYDTSF